MNETVFIPKITTASETPLDDGPGHAPSEISGSLLQNKIYIVFVNIPAMHWRPLVAECKNKH